MPDYLKVEGSNNLVRDPNSGAILNISKSDYETYISRKQLIQKQQLELEQQKSEINNIKNDIAEIKSLLIKLLDK